MERNQSLGHLDPGPQPFCHHELTARLTVGLFAAGRLNSALPEPYVFPRPPPFCASPNFPSESGRLVPFPCKATHLSGTGIQTGKGGIFPCLPLQNKIRRVPLSVQKAGEVLPSPVSCISHKQLCFCGDSDWQATVGLEWCIRCRHSTRPVWLMETVSGAGYMAWASEKECCHLHPTVCLVIPGNTFHLGTSEREGLFLPASLQYPCVAQSMDHAISLPLRSLR